MIATKGGVVRTSDSAWHIEGRPERLREMCEASLRRLRTDRIDLYQLHRLDPAVPMAEQLGALEELRAEGKIRHIGLDSVTAEQLAEALTLSSSIVSVQNRFNLLDRESAAVLKVCEAHGLAFLPWFPLANGALTGSAAALDAVAARHGASRGQIALAWLLHHSPALLPTPGTGSLAHLEENLDAAGIRLAAAEVTLLDALGPGSSPPA